MCFITVCIPLHSARRIHTRAVSSVVLVSVQWLAGVLLSPQLELARATIELQRLTNLRSCGGYSPRLHMGCQSFERAPKAAYILRHRTCRILAHVVPSIATIGMGIEWLSASLEASLPGMTRAAVERYRLPNFSAVANLKGTRTLEEYFYL